MTAPRLAIHVTDRCQLDCEHCLRDPGAKGQDLSLAQIERVLRETRAHYGSDDVTFTGGEPTLHRQFVEIIDAVVAHGFRWAFISNGEKFDRILARLDEVPARVAAIRQLHFSLDGGTELTHDIIRGRGSFAAVGRAMALCKARGIPFAINTTIQRQNRHEIEAVVMLAARAGAREVFFELAQPTGTYLDPVLFIPATELPDVVDAIARMAARVAIGVRVADGFPAPSAMAMCESLQFGVIYVGADGAYNGCCRHAGVPGPERDPFVLGDVATTSVHDAHQQVIALGEAFFAWRATDLATSTRQQWQAPLCNDCLGFFGRPHWRDDGSVGGAEAQRPRWRGAWTPSDTRKDRVAAAVAERDGE